MNFTVKEVKNLKGDSAVMIRKGKKIVTYDYQVTLEWNCFKNDDANTKVDGFVEGEFFLPEISNDIIDDGEEFDV
jgi:activator of HSP90 ATPase